MTQRLLAIEKKLNITITIPQICYLCGEEITKKYGKDSDSLCFHSLDGNHDNWDPSNKRPTHKGCHGKYHRKGTHHSEETKRKLSKSQIRAHAQRGMTKLIKPVIRSGGSRVVVIPDSWLRALEDVHGTILKEMELDLNDEEIRITPIWENEE